MQYGSGIDWQKQHEEYLRKMQESIKRSHERSIYESIYSQNQNQNQVGDGSASGSGGGGNPNSAELTPFILQSWGIGEIEDWGLYRLKTDGSKVPVENAPPLEGPTVFAKNTLNGFHYFVTYNVKTETSNFGRWDSITGDWIFLEEGTPLLRNLAPTSLQYIEGNDDYPSYFIYTDNSQYGFGGEEDTAPKTFRIDLDTPTSFELTELHEWEIPSTVYYSFPVSVFYQLPVAVGASPSQDLFSVQQYGASEESPFPFADLSSINGDTYERTLIDTMTIDGLSIDAVKLAFILDRTDYNGDTYFNIFATDKINETQINYIAKFNPDSEDPANLTSIYQYVWDTQPYVSLTTI